VREGYALPHLSLDDQWERQQQHRGEYDDEEIVVVPDSSQKPLHHVEQLSNLW
jgi:hypothetical protein